MDEAEDVVEDTLVVGILLELHDLDVNDIDAFRCFGEKLIQQVIHGRTQLPLDRPEPFPMPGATGLASPVKTPLPRGMHGRPGPCSAHGAQDRGKKLKSS